MLRVVIELQIPDNLNESKGSLDGKIEAFLEEVEGEFPGVKVGRTFRMPAAQREFDYSALYANVLRELLAERGGTAEVNPDLWGEIRPEHREGMEVYGEHWCGTVDPVRMLLVGLSHA